MCSERKKTAAFMVIVGIVLLGTTTLLARLCPPQPGKMQQVQCCITFTGEASGGTLIMSENLGRNVIYVAIETKAGEPVEKVVERLANIIEETNPFDWMITPIGERKFGERIVTSSGGDLQGLVGSCVQYMTAGTETGLGIPQPPHSLTANYDPNSKKVSLRWINPPGGYDSVRIRINWGNYDHSGGDELAGNAESYVIDLGNHPIDMNDLDILVIGVRNDIPSNAAAIHINNKIQEELFGIPFTSGLAPNWQRWSLDVNEGAVNPQMGIKSALVTAKGRRYNPIKKPQDKPFYQIINVGDKGGTGGVFRKFIGLTPGHTYRVKARVAILSEPTAKNWSVCLFIAPNGTDGRNLSPRQMAGLDALPYGEKNKFAEISADKANRAAQGVTDITLPLNIDSITVWLKCTSSASLSAVIDWISVEDLWVEKL